jgi:hypothetical protein
MRYEDYILNAVEEGEEDVVPTEQDAIDALINTDMDMMTMLTSPVTVPSDEDISATITSERETVYAESLVKQLIDNGYLVTDLDALDEDDNALHADFKSRFTTVAISGSI